VSQVNLLPPELRQRQAIRKMTSMIIAIGLVVLALIGAFYFVQVQHLSDAESELEAQQARNAELSAQVLELQQYSDLQAELASKEALLSTIYQYEVAWSSALLDVSRVIPDASYLTSLTGQITASSITPPAGTTPESTLIGNMAFAGVAEQTETIATWLVRLEEVVGWVNAWANSAQENSAFSGIYNFSNGIDLNIEATTERGHQAVIAP
jgi:Tfp pilus assembly protein PilN